MPSTPPRTPEHPPGWSASPRLARIRRGSPARTRPRARQARPTESRSTMTSPMSGSVRSEMDVDWSCNPVHSPMSTSSRTSTVVDKASACEHPAGHLRESRIRTVRCPGPSPWCTVSRAGTPALHDSVIDRDQTLRHFKTTGRRRLRAAAGRAHSGVAPATRAREEPRARSCPAPADQPRCSTHLAEQLASAARISAASASSTSWS